MTFRAGQKVILCVRFHHHQHHHHHHHHHHLAGGLPRAAREGAQQRGKHQHQHLRQCAQIPPVAGVDDDDDDDDDDF